MTTYRIKLLGPSRFVMNEMTGEYKRFGTKYEARRYAELSFPSGLLNHSKWEVVP